MHLLRSICICIFLFICVLLRINIQRIVSCFSGKKAFNERSQSIGIPAAYPTYDIKRAPFKKSGKYILITLTRQIGVQSTHTYNTCIEMSIKLFFFFPTSFRVGYYRFYYYFSLSLLQFVIMALGHLVCVCIYGNL